jgi:hypothetical protein
LAFVLLVLGYATGFTAFFCSLSASTRSQYAYWGSRMEFAAVFAGCCDLVSIILGVTVNRRTSRGSRIRTWLVVLCVFAGIGIVGAMCLFVFGSMFVECGNCNTSGCRAPAGGFGPTL